MSDRLPDWATVALGHGTHSRFARHIRIEQPSHSIKGRYTIGPAARDHRPPLYDMPLDQVVGQTSASASFETRSSAVAAEVWIMANEEDGSEADPHGHRRHLSVDGKNISKNKPISVAAKSYMGRVQISIPRYTPSHPLHLRAKSHNGSVHIVLPPTFSGLVSWRTESGQLKLSRAIEERYINLGEAFKHRGTGMLLAKGQPKPGGHIVGQAKAVVEKKGLQPRLLTHKAKSRPTTPDLKTAMAHAGASAAGAASGNSSPNNSFRHSQHLASGRTSPAHSSGQASPSAASLASGAATVEGDSPDGPGLGLPAHAAETAAKAGATVTRGDACELITTYGNIYIYEVGEKVNAAGVSENCVVM